VAEQENQGGTATVPPTSDAPTSEAPPQEAPQEQSEEEKWRDEQRLAAQSQNLDSEDAVPEKRPIASQVNVVTDDALTKQLKERGAIGNDGRMDKEAYDRAASDQQAKEAAKNSTFEAIKVADMVEVTKGPHEGRFVAVTRIESYEDSADLAVRTAGVPEARFVQPKTIEGRARGDSRDGEILVLSVKDDGLRKVDWMGTGRG
jgi:hypothetical protein